MSFADAFAAALAARHDATLWTGDPELLVEGSPWQWRDLRSSGRLTGPPRCRSALPASGPRSTFSPARR
jgi:hypothetical protein